MLQKLVTRFLHLLQPLNDNERGLLLKTARRINTTCAGMKKVRSGGDTRPTDLEFVGRPTLGCAFRDSLIKTLVGHSRDSLEIFGLSAPQGFCGNTHTLRLGSLQAERVWG